jgi:Putative mono-oxygenase ydhR
VHALVATYSLERPRVSQYSEFCEQFAPAVAAVNGLVSATWLANLDTGRFGGFYVFEAKPDFDRFIASELFEAWCRQESLAKLMTRDFTISGQTAGSARFGRTIDVQSGQPPARAAAAGAGAAREAGRD